jgi:hypothetical protein
VSNPSINDPFAAATKGQLQQMLAQAETYLNAQLQIGTAADQRALVFAGFIAAIVVAAGGGASALLLAGDSLFLGYLGFATVAGLLVSLACAVHAARPVSFEYPGNSPAEWAQDISTGKSLLDSMREQAAHYATMIETNNRTLESNCIWLRRSQMIALWVLTLGGAACLAFFLTRDLIPFLCSLA